MWTASTCAGTWEESLKMWLYLVAIAVNEDGCWEVLVAAEGMKADKASRAEPFK